MTDPMARLATSLADRYRLERELGAGGMATVYLAEDLRHQRQVALKVLRPELAAVIGAQRFLAEIRTTANLQHPHILPLHDSGEADGTVYYVMPFVAGESLRDRLTREKQLPVGDAVRIASEVAGALDYAHRQGVIHRDIKPENILLHDGRALVADFGIALAASRTEGGARMTETGMSLGTPHYMSPEQAMGERVLDGRTDIYALGCVLYEMLTGEPPFGGPTAQAIVAKVMNSEPEPVSTLRKTVPPHVEAAVLTALAKLPADRFATAAELSAVLTGESVTGWRPVGAPARVVTWGRWARDPRTVAILALTGVATIWLALGPGGRRAAPAEVTRLTIEPPASLGPFMSNQTGVSSADVSPDNQWVAFGGTTLDTPKVVLRRLDRFESRVVPGAAWRPFFSPDGRWLGFIRNLEVWKVPVEDGEPVRVGGAPDLAWNLTGLLWHPTQGILLTTPRGLWSLPDAGGEARLLVASDSARRELFYHPVRLSDGRVLLEVRVPDAAASVIAVSLPDGERRPLPAAVTPPVHVVEDLILFGANPVRIARLDLRRLELIGPAVPVSGVPPSVELGAGGSAVWLDSTSQKFEPVWVGPDGAATPLGLAPDNYRWPRLSPSGTAVVYHSSSLGWFSVTDLRAGTRVRLGQLTKPNEGSEPVWTPDAQRIVYSMGNLPTAGIYIQPANGSSPPDSLYVGGDHDSWPTHFSPDGKVLAFYGAVSPSPNDLYFLDMESRTTRRLTHPGDQKNARFSPDGRWIAYQSDESGRSEIYVRSYPDLDATWIVSSGGGDEPLWAPNGRRLYYRSSNRVFTVDIASGASFTASPPREVLRGAWFHDPFGDFSWDLAPDGRFLFLRPAASTRVQVNVIRHWIGEARALLEGSAR